MEYPADSITHVTLKSVIGYFLIRPSTSLQIKYVNDTASLESIDEFRGSDPWKKKQWFESMELNRVYFEDRLINCEQRGIQSKSIFKSLTKIFSFMSNCSLMVSFYIADVSMVPMPFCAV